MFLYNNHLQPNRKLYKGKRKIKSDFNSISGAGLTTTKSKRSKKRNSKKKRVKKRTVRLVQKNINFLKRLGLKIKKK